MPLVILPHNFVDGPGNTASGEEVMDNLNAILDALNGSIDSDNIADGTQIAVGYIYATAPTDTVNTPGDAYYRAAGGDHNFIATLGTWGTCHAAAYTVESDMSGKSGIKPIKGALDRLAKVSGVTFKRKGSNSRHAGVVAQDVQAALPEAARSQVRKADPENKEASLGVDVMGVVGLLVEAVKELSAEVEALKASG